MLTGGVFAAPFAPAPQDGPMPATLLHIWLDNGRFTHHTVPFGVLAALHGLEGTRFTEPNVARLFHCAMFRTAAP